ncbi:MAG: TonB-dependent receptor domain-containing protein [Novosphingobium sp.]
MPNSFVRSFRRSVIGGVALAGLIPALAMAQGAAPSGEGEAAPRDEIIVTGTLIRGVAPPGASPVTVDSKKIQESGATTVAQVLQTVPQLGAFQGLQAPSAASPEVSVNRPNLRSLPGFNTSGGSTTLVLMDGHRLVGMGSTTTTPDPDVIPPGVLRRLEIVPDGGSAIYGSDAVAGVLNFITIDRFDGIRIDASYGFADDYYRYDAAVLAGKDWGSGSLFVAYNYAKGDQLLGIDRDYIRQFPSAGDGRIEIQCTPGNVRRTSDGSFFPIPSAVAGTANQCDSSDYSSLYPAYQRHSVFAGLTQQLSDSIKIDIRAFYSNRKTTIQSGPFRFTTSLTAAQALALAPPAYAGLGAQDVLGSFGANDASTTDLSLEAWGVTPTITATLGEKFQLRVMGTYGESTANRRAAVLDTTALSNRVLAGAFNPYNPSTASAATLASLTNLQDFGRTRQYLTNLRVVLDGDLFELPSGAVKIAVGGEYSHEKFVAQNGTTVPGFENGGFAGNGINTVTAPIPIYRLSRNVKSLFGELVVPVLGRGSGPELTLSAAGRYDFYSDVGGTFNPRFGATFKPVDWIAIRGAWGTSFTAPSLADDANASSTQVFFLPSFINAGFRPPADLVASGAYPAYVAGTGILAVRGNSPGIEPQTATTWTIGFDVSPPVVPGLTFGATYFNIDYSNFIGLPPFENADALYRFNGNVIRTTFNQTDITAIIAQDTDGIIAPLGTSPGSITAAGTYAIFDARKRNFGSVKVDGVDFRASYRKETGFGALFANLNGTYDFNRKQQSGASAPFLDQVTFGTNRLRTRATFGGEIGNFLGQLTWNHRSGYNLQAPQGFTGTALGVAYVAQAKVDSFNTIDLFFKYDFKGAGLTEDLSLTLNVENLFDTAPPEFRGNTTGVAPGIQNGNTIGRFVKIGVSKKF